MNEVYFKKLPRIDYRYMYIYYIKYKYKDG